ncbi:conserved hypothetical protein [Desulfamplus magnetovallimortis]|uniref:YkgJ family cysteine cluster protein n=1 Tax=Desulfamplus magnetovallimortis TaxID=1246637 RepID=A0A1W1HB33_9BACT|nr:YkgJ family cysteine cluster protein [Desulfamplus magnetovallimortis]SLM29704.1 conserved hypothetical protein [Desulfamplus magnetovallimortis]
MSLQNECKRCGTCCENGGPALHGSDMTLIENCLISIESLIAIRKGELAHDPVTDSLKPVKKEFLKIAGKKGTWECLFYEKVLNGCTIYENRPLACSVLKCWDTEETLKLAGRDLLSRLDIIKADDPMRKHIKKHEMLFPVPDLMGLSSPSSKMVKKLEKICNREIDHRMKIVNKLELTVAKELFYFGRPIFELLHPLGFRVMGAGKGIKLDFL